MCGVCVCVCVYSPYIKAEHQAEHVPCPDCSQGVRRRALALHAALVCPHRPVQCPHLDCDAGSLPAHHLATHLRLECASRMARRKAWLVERARERVGYARPWGIEISMMEDDEEEGGAKGQFEGGGEGEESQTERVQREGLEEEEERRRRSEIALRFAGFDDELDDEDEGKDKMKEKDGLLGKDKLAEDST